MGSKNFVKLTFSHTCWDELDKQVGGEILIYVLVDGSLGLVSGELILTLCNMVIDKKVRALWQLCLIHLFKCLLGGL